MAKAQGHEDLISRAKYKLYQKYPFFHYLVKNMNIYVDETIPTLCVSNRGEMRYSPTFIEEQGNNKDLKGKDRILAFLCHEVLHLAYRHPARAKGKNIILTDETGQQVSLWNIAIDIIVNNTILMNGLFLGDVGIQPKNNEVTVFKYTVKDISEKSGEDIYYELLKHLKDEVQKNKGKGQSSDGGYFVSGLPEDFDDHKFDEEPKEGEGESSGSDEGEAKEKDWGKLIQQAANYQKQRGKDPMNLGREFTVFNNSQINWKSFIRKEVGNKIPSDYTWMKPNKKGMAFGMILPSLKKDQAVNVLIHIDTSGSMSTEDLSYVMTEAYHLSRNSRAVVRIITSDCQVMDDILVDSGSEEKLKSIKIQGGGGTDHNPVYEYIQKMRYNSQYSLLISFTDGYSCYPNKPNIDTLFVLTKSHIPVTQMPKWGRVIEMQ